MSICTYFLKPLDTPPNLEELKTRISSAALEDKAAAVKDLIRCIVND